MQHYPTNKTSRKIAMIKVKIQKQAHVDAESVWKMLRNFGDMSWFPLAGKIECTGSGPGMVRRIITPDGGHIDEKLESLDDQDKILAYSIAKSPAFPFGDYQAQVAVKSLSSTETGIHWSCSFDPGAMPESDARAMIEGIYGQLIDALFLSVKQL
jgi:hypothetical protein